MTRGTGLAYFAVVGILACGAPAAAAETIDLKFDWGPELKAVIDATLQPPLRTTPPPTPSTSTPPGAVATPIPGSAGAMTRSGPLGTRFRIAATKQSDGSYAVRIVDYLLRLGYGDILISGDPRSRQALHMMAPDVKFDASGRFAGLLDPEAVTATLQQMPRPSPEQNSAIPPEAREQAQAQLRWMTQLRATEARAAEPWVEAVGHWAGRSLVIGETYRETETVDAVARGRGPGPYQLERTWSALGREPCASSDAANGADQERRDCVRLRLTTRYTVSAPAIALSGAAPTQDRITFETEVTLLTEPATLRPHEITTVRRSLNESTVPPQPREFDNSRTTWTYGPKADVALQASIDPTRLPPSAGGPAAASPPPPARIWPAGSPERMVADYFELGRARNTEGATKLLHPDLIGRAATRIRGPEGVRQSDEMRKALVGEELTVEQVDAMADDVLFARVTARATADDTGAFSTMPMGGAVEVIGHLLDAAGHAHVVVHPRMQGFPAQFAYRSFTIVADRLPAAARAASRSGEVALPACSPKSDAAGCWRIWLYDNIEFSLLLRRRFSIGPGVVSRPSIAPAPPPPPAVIVAPEGGTVEHRP